MKYLRLLFVIFLAVNGYQCVKNAWWEPVRADMTKEELRKRRSGSDFTAYYSAGELARRGDDIYDFRKSSTPRRPYIYPPTFAVVPMAPLSLLPHNTAAGVFYVLNALMLCASMHMLRRILSGENTKTPGESTKSNSPIWLQPEFATLLAVGICWRYVHSNLKLGNANMYILFLLVIGLWYLVKNRDFKGGLIVALATAFKVTPGLFGLYFLWARRTWAMLGGAVGLVLFLVLLPMPFLGVKGTIDTLGAFYKHASSKALDEEDATDIPGSKDVQNAFTDAQGKPADDLPRAVGISLRGTLMKLLSKSEALNHRAEGEDKTVNIAELDPRTAKRIADIAALILLAVTVWLTWSKVSSSTPQLMALSWGLTTVTMLLISPLTRKAHLTVLIIPVTALIVLLQEGTLSGAAKKTAWAALLLLGLGGLFTSEDIIGIKGSEVAHAMGISTWSMLLLFIALVLAIRQRQVVKANAV